MSRLHDPKQLSLWKFCLRLWFRRDKNSSRQWGRAAGTFQWHGNWSRARLWTLRSCPQWHTSTSKACASPDTTRRSKLCICEGHFSGKTSATALLLWLRTLHFTSLFGLMAYVEILRLPGCISINLRFKPGSWVGSQIHGHLYRRLYQSLGWPTG